MADNNEELIQRLMDCVRAANSVAAQDVGFIKSIDKPAYSALTNQSDAIMELISSIVETVAPTAMISNEDFGDTWSTVASALDFFTDATLRSLDAAKADVAEGSSRRGGEGKEAFEPQTRTYTTKPKNWKSREFSENIIATKSQTVAHKPQLDFEQSVDNTPGKPFIPLLKSKPFAMVPLERSLTAVVDPKTGMLHYANPYAKEIEQYPYPDVVSDQSEKFPSTDWNNTSYIFVDTKELLASMIEKLSKQKVIAVDLEFHSYRSYKGFTCLIQISTKSQDYIVDAILLRAELEALNEVFCDPNIVKVFHGASSDIRWLQSDFGVYVTSLFDTLFAANELYLPQKSLAFLLEHYEHFTTSKKYQLDDWRRRPLPLEMLAYARGDTHFLLSIFEKMRNELIAKGDGALERVLAKSREQAAGVYENPGYDSVVHNKYFSRISKHFTSLQMAVATALFELRDAVARDMDESPFYVMREANITAIVSRLPTSEDKWKNANLPREGASGFNVSPAKVIDVVNEVIKRQKESFGNTLHFPVQKQEVRSHVTPESLDRYTSQFDNVRDARLSLFSSSKEAAKRVQKKQSFLPVDRVSLALKNNVNRLNALDLHFQTVRPKLRLASDDADAEVDKENQQRAQPVQEVLSDEEKGNDALPVVEEPSHKTKNGLKKLKVTNDMTEFQPKKSQERERQEQSYEAYDYNNASSVFTDAAKKPTKDSKKRFDPYGQIVAPRGATRRARGLKGKSTSFKAKK